MPLSFWLPFALAIGRPVRNTANGKRGTQGTIDGQYSEGDFCSFAEPNGTATVVILPSPREAHELSNAGAKRVSYQRH